MASQPFLVAIIVALAVAPAIATDYMVGGDSGWNLKVNYTEWAAGKDFRVGDTLMFMYTPGNDSVYGVTGPNFQQCNTTGSLLGPFTSGNDSIPLAKTGKKWYISGFQDHCSQGMKLVITVNEALAPAPAPTSAASKIVKSSAWMLATAAAYWMMMA